MRPEVDDRLLENRTNILSQQNENVEKRIKNVPQVKCLNESEATDTSTACMINF